MTFDEKMIPTGSDALLRVQQYAKNRVIEPFEGQTGFETLQRANRTISHGTEKVKELGRRIQTSKLTSTSIDKLDQLWKSAKLFNNFEKMTEIFKTGGSEKYKEFEEKFKESIYAFLKKGLELTLKEDYEPWIVKNSAPLLNRPIYSFREIQQLEDSEREILINALYPYSSHRYKGLLASFDKTFNVLLGVVVASNLPGTGVIVSLITMAKTIVRLSNRINSMSVLYGYPVINLNQLYKVCSLLLTSIADWEENDQHVPLDPSVLSELYSETNDDIEEELTKLLEVVGTKEMYIAIPGVGMLSLSKINLDDYKIDLMVQNLVSDYFFLNNSGSLTDFDSITADYIQIYQVFKKQDLLNKLRQRMDLGVTKTKKERFFTKLKSLTGEDPEFNRLIANIHFLARNIHHEIRGVQGSQKENVMNQMIMEFEREFQ